MYRLLLDTNILLDAVMPGRPQREEALGVMRRCNGAGDMGFVSPLSLKDAYHVLEHEYDESIARAGVEFLMDLLVVCPISAEECMVALRSSEADFANGLLRACAELEGADFIITRNASAFAKSKVRSMTAREYLELAEEEEA